MPRALKHGCERSPIARAALIALSGQSAADAELLGVAFEVDRSLNRDRCLFFLGQRAHVAVVALGTLASVGRQPFISGARRLLRGAPPGVPRQELRRGRLAGAGSLGCGTPPAGLRRFPEPKNMAPRIEPDPQELLLVRL
jgi:hypothetical protein